ncbi:ABC transporter permease subunit [Clostridium aestuarii]|uniref:ABC transporter permease subunit n=1 Tax=Clostridium aestuarii TaxID=338193 RepID=A0ABT4CVR8_9CLOT|nr:ABC transporter permease subunit [Clostridium aestuarii]MCY6483092.1 ABC transporter permease subunit [Clostridium aestuarii]
MNVFLHELKTYRKSTIIWTLSLIVIVIIYLSMFPAFLKDIDQMKNLLKGFPEAIRNGMGISLNNFGNILGYYSFPLSFVILIGAIQAMNLGTSVISYESRKKTADFLLTKPITRTQILTSKILAVITSLVITNILYITVANITASAVTNNSYSFKTFFMLSITLLFVQLIFMSMGIIISVILPKIKSVISISLGTVFVFYFINFLSSADEAIRYITPFKYFDTGYIIENNSYETPFIIIALLFIAITIITSYVIYSKKDIHTS